MSGDPEHAKAKACEAVLNASPASTLEPRVPYRNLRDRGACSDFAMQHAYRRRR